LWVTSERSDEELLRAVVARDVAALEADRKSVV
jgi:hypothetical protein